MAKNGKSLEEIMQKIAEMQKNAGNKKKLPDEQIRLFVSEEMKGAGKADPNS